MRSRQLLHGRLCVCAFTSTSSVWSDMSLFCLVGHRRKVGRLVAQTRGPSGVDPPPCQPRARPPHDGRSVYGPEWLVVGFRTRQTTGAPCVCLVLQVPATLEVRSGWGVPGVCHPLPPSKWLQGRGSARSARSARVGWGSPSPLLLLLLPLPPPILRKGWQTWQIPVLEAIWRVADTWQTPGRSPCSAVPGRFCTVFGTGWDASQSVFWHV
jgi:hypothetical protein